MSDSIRLGSVTVNCPDAAELAAFYADITGGRITFTNPDWAVVSSPGGRIDFQTVPDHTPPTWPGNASPNRLHAVRAHLLEMDGRDEQALATYAIAARLATSIPEQRYLNAKASR